MGILPVVSKDQGNDFISDVMSLVALLDGCVGVFFSIGLSTFGGVFMFSEEGKMLSMVVLEGMAWKREKLYL